jgi:hypothetical protein
VAAAQRQTCATGQVRSADPSAPTLRRGRQQAGQNSGFRGIRSVFSNLRARDKSARLRK